MLAVIKTGGKQYLVEPGKKITIEKLDIEEGKETVFSDVLLLEKNNDVRIGNPMVKGATVTGKIVKHGKADKVIIFKYKPKKRYKRKIGHRQLFTQVEILEIKG